MKIQDDVRKYIPSFSHENYAGMQLSVFFVTTESSRIKLIDFRGLNRDQRRLLAKDNAIALVLTKADDIFAHVHHSHLKNAPAVDDITINNKKVTFKALNDEEYDELSLGGFFDELIEKGLEEESATQHHSLYGSYRPFYRSSFLDGLAKKYLMNGQMYVKHLMAYMGSFSNQVLELARIMNEAVQKENQRRREDQKRTDIIEEEIRRQTLKNEIAKKHIQQENLH